MNFSLFISDIHLRATGRKTNQLFRQFIQQTAPQAEALYILGDLFEYWAGDDDLNTRFHQGIIQDLRALSGKGTRLYLMHGNRDFLMGEKLAQACQAKLLTDPLLINLYGTPTLITHGDLLCTDDEAYQAFRRQVREISWQQQFLSQSLTQRKAKITEIRQQSEAEKQKKSVSIMDVNLQTVHNWLEKYQYPQMIHGHTHRLAHHLHHLDGHTCNRWVLGDWEKRPNALRCSVSGVNWEVLTNK